MNPVTSVPQRWYEQRRTVNPRASRSKTARLEAAQTLGTGGEPTRPRGTALFVGRWWSPTFVFIRFAWAYRAVSAQLGRRTWTTMAGAEAVVGLARSVLHGEHPAGTE
jgi:hypothetical protein